MESITHLLTNYWWVIALIIAVLVHKLILKLFGIIIIPENKIGLITKKFVLSGDNKTLPDGRIIATKGEAGFQAKTLASGLYFWYWPWQYVITEHEFIVIQEGHIGCIQAKDGAPLPTGHILGRKVQCDSFQDAEEFLNNGGMKGTQAAFITNGTYRINTFLFEVTEFKMTTIEPNKVGVVRALDGQPITDGGIAGSKVDGHNNFQDADSFLAAGGNKGLQPPVILSGTYFINPWAFSVEEIPMTKIEIGHCGVVICLVGEDGEDRSGESFKHGNLVDKNKKGVWEETLNPGVYPINKYTHIVESVPTTNIVLNWADALSESHKLDENLSTIKLRSKDGFSFTTDVSQIMHIPQKMAPRVISRFGTLLNLVSQVLEPTIGNYFRNAAQDAEVLDFLGKRSEKQQKAKEHINKELTSYNVEGVDTLIGDITVPEAIMKTLSDRKIAVELKATYEAQKDAQTARENYEKANAIANMQGQVVAANQGVEIAQKQASAQVESARGKSESVKLIAAAEAEKIKITGEAEGVSILAIGQATAESYKLQVEAMGKEQFAAFKTTELIGQNNIRIMPEMLIMGGAGSGSSIDGLLGMTILEKMGKTISPATILEIKEKKEGPDSKDTNQLN